MTTIQYGIDPVLNQFTNLLPTFAQHHSIAWQGVL